MRGEEQFHAGIVVDDFDAALARLTDLFGYEWCDPMELPTTAIVAAGSVVLDLKFTYSRTEPRLEIIRSIPGTLWVPATGSGIHHLGYWSDDLAGDAAALEAAGFAREAAGLRPDGALNWTYHRAESGPRIELVDRAVHAGLEHYWTAGGTR